LALKTARGLLPYYVDSFS